MLFSQNPIVAIICLEVLLGIYSIALLVVSKKKPAKIVNGALAALWFLFAVLNILGV